MRNQTINQKGRRYQKDRRYQMDRRHQKGRFERSNGLRSWRRRSGISHVEFLVSFAVLISTMTFVTTMAVQVNRIWKDIQHDRLAANELSNHLDVLTRLKGNQLITAAEKLTPSIFCQNGLADPRLSATLTSVPFGQRIDLELQWKRLPEPRTVRLSGWAIDSNATGFQRAVNESIGQTEGRSGSNDRPDSGDRPGSGGRSPRRQQP